MNIHEVFEFTGGKEDLQAGSEFRLHLGQVYSVEKTSLY